MLHQYQQEIILILVILSALFLFTILKKRSKQKTIDDLPQNDNVTSAPVDTQSKTTFTSSENTKLPEVAVTPQEIPEQSESRRKSDRTIEKRPVPEGVKVTKQNFCEFAGQRVLIAEDNIINQKVILGLLGGSGIELVVANDGQEALDILQNDSNFLMILMDANMPRVDGFQATRTIRANPAYDHILVVALSGDTAADDIKKMKEAGMSEQLEKPLRMESLYKIFYAYTGQKSNETQEKSPNKTHIAKELNSDIGLEACGGDEEFYREILSEFMLDYSDSSRKLGDLLRSNDLLGADKLLLDIIGVASNIGANLLGGVAVTLKLALSDTQEKSYFSLFDRYKIHLATLQQEIKEYLKQ